MIEPKLEVPAELRDLAEKTIDQAEKAFGMFFEAATKSVSSVPGAGAEVSKQALAFTEQNMKSAFEHARKLVHATELPAQPVHQRRRPHAPDDGEFDATWQGQVLTLCLPTGCPQIDLARRQDASFNRGAGP